MPEDHASEARTPLLGTDIASLRDLAKAGRYEEALAAAETVLPEAQGQRDLGYLIAVCLRCLRRLPEALDALAALENDHPDYSLLHQERGYCRVSLQDIRGSIRAFERAVALNPALVASRTMLERLCRLAGDEAGATRAAAALAGLARLPAEVVEAGRLFSDGDIAAAEEILKKAPAASLRHPEARRLLGRIAHRSGSLAAAEQCLGEAVALLPESLAARTDYARVLVDRQNFPRALEELERLLERNPSDAGLRTLYAAVCASIGEHEQAVEMYRTLYAETGGAELLVMMGHSAQAIGRRDEAVRAYRHAAEIRPTFGDAWWSLANLKTQRFSPAEIARMRAAEADPASSTSDRAHLCFALGKAYEDAAAFAESWRFYERGNALKRSEFRYLPEVADALAREVREVFTADFFAERAGCGALDPDPIFVVGLPRSGSTLIEQILASHSRVEGTRELSDIPRLIADLVYERDAGGAARHPGVLREVDPREFDRLGRQYLTDTCTYRTGREFFIDKMPNNFRYVGPIHLMLPNARIIDVRRDPNACCFANLKQLFASGQEFAYDQRDIARYYRTYLDYMRHWDQVLPGRVLRVVYEDLVADLEGSVRRILEHCGLEFEPECLAFHRTDRVVSTPSSEQVRQPIYRDALAQWRNYEPWLGPMRAALGDAATHWRD